MDKYEKYADKIKDLVDSILDDLEGSDCLTALASTCVTYIRIVREILDDTATEDTLHLFIKEAIKSSLGDGKIIKPDKIH